MTSQYNDWKRNPTPQALLNPWTKWVKRNVNFPISSSSDRPPKKGVRFQREIQQYISSPTPDEPPYPTTSTHIRHEPPPLQRQEPPSPEKLLPLLTKDDKYYLIGQKLSSLLNQDQQKRLLRDALDAGKLPPGTNAGSNCICPDIMVDIQNMIREEFDHGLAQAQRMVMPTNNVFVINQGPGFEKPLPGIPQDEWSGQNMGYNYLYGQGNGGTTSTEVYYSNGFEAVNIQPSPEPEARQQKLELTSLRFPKPGMEPFLHCSHCQTDHPTRLFSPAQRKVPPGVRKCIAREGYVRLCAHKVVTWGLIEACLLKELESQEVNQDHARQEGHGSFTFACHHPSHPRAPEVTIYTSLPREEEEDEEFGNHFGRVVLRWSTTQPACSVPFNLFPDFLASSATTFDNNNTMYHHENLSDLPEDGSSNLNKNVICPGPGPSHASSSPPVPPPHRENMNSNNPPTQPDNLQVPGLQTPRSHTQSMQASPRSDSRSSFRLSSDISSTLSSSYPRSSYSSFNTCMAGSSRPESAMTDHDCGCTPPAVTSTTAYNTAARTPDITSATPTTPGTSTPTSTRIPTSTTTTGHGSSSAELRYSEMTINAVDIPTLDIDEFIESQMQPHNNTGPPGSYANPTEPCIARHRDVHRDQPVVRINPSEEWYAAVHPDSYSLDKWAKEGLFGLRWCAEPECKSYLAVTRGQVASGGTGGGNSSFRGKVHRGCRLGGSSCI